MMEEVVALANHRQQEGHDHRFDDYVSEHEGLHDGIDGKHAGGNICEDRCRAAEAITDAEQQNVCGTLQDGETNYGMNEMPAGDQAVEPAKKDPRGDEIRQ